MKQLQIPIATLGSIAMFLWLTFSKDWDFAAAAAVSVATYFGLFYTFTPVTKLGNKTFTDDNDADELYQLLNNSRQTLQGLETVSLNDKSLESELKDIIKIGNNIVAYLEDHYDDLSSSRHFLSHYITTLDKIVRNYDGMEDLHLSGDKKERLREMTFDSLQNLKKIFTQQLQNYHNNTIRELEVEQELLSRTIKMGEYKE